MPAVTQFDTGAFNARMAEFRRAAQENSGGHSVQKAANKGGVDVGAINATSQKYVEGIKKFNEAMKALQIQDPSGTYSQMVSDLQSAVSSFMNRPKVAAQAQSNLLSRSKVSSML